MKGRAMKLAFRPDGVITAGNSSQIKDGAAGLLITTSEVGQLGLAPLARVHMAVAACRRLAQRLCPCSSMYTAARARANPPRPKLTTPEPR
jgi:acetyl-CoA acetyltransferase